MQRQQRRANSAVQGLRYCWTVMPTPDARSKPGGTSLDRAKLGHGQHNSNDAWACRSTILMPPKYLLLRSRFLGTRCHGVPEVRCKSWTVASLHHGCCSPQAWFSRSAFCSEDKSQTGLSSACSSAQSDKNLDFKDECFSGHCKTGQCDQACSTAGFNFLVPTSRRHYQQGY